MALVRLVVGPLVVVTITIFRGLLFWSSQHWAYGFFCFFSMLWHMDNTEKGEKAKRWKWQREKSLRQFLATLEKRLKSGMETETVLRNFLFQNVAFLVNAKVAFIFDSSNVKTFSITPVDHSAKSATALFSKLHNAHLSLNQSI